MINEEALKQYLRMTFPDARGIGIRKLGAGVQGAGFLVSMETDGGGREYVVKGLFPEGLEHDYPADRAGVFLLDLEAFNHLPGHVRAIDVLAEMSDGTIRSIGGGREYYLLMERAEGKDYFRDLSVMAGKKRLDASDVEKIQAMTSYLAEIHAVKKDSKALYWRKVRDTIGHGECLMGVFDTYPEGAVPPEDMTGIERKCVDWRARLKPRFKRLCQVHGDFHPGNIWFRSNRDFILLDRSRGPWGEAADDITALTINYIFYALNRYGRFQGACLEALNLFYDQYMKQSGDWELPEVVAPFYAFRGAVVANPLFYPDVTPENRRKIFNFINAVLDDDSFHIDRVNEYIETGTKAQRHRGTKNKRKGS